MHGWQFGSATALEVEFAPARKASALMNIPSVAIAT